MKGHLNPAFAWISRLPIAASSLAPWDEPHSELASWASDWALWPNRACHLAQTCEVQPHGHLWPYFKTTPNLPVVVIFPTKKICSIQFWHSFHPCFLINENLRIASLPGPQQLLLAHWGLSYWSLLTTILNYSKVRCTPWGLTADLG